MKNIFIFSPLCKGSQSMSTLGHAWNYCYNVLLGVVVCTDYVLVFGCEDSPEEANTDYDPSLIALLL